MPLRKMFLRTVFVAVAFTSISSAETRVVLSPPYLIDKIYRSMEGPQSTQAVSLLPHDPPELVWVTGFKTEMVSEDGKTPSKPEFMCHVNLDMNVGMHQKHFGPNRMTGRILTLSQGQVVTQFPKGFGIPVMSDEPFSMTTQVLNHNLHEVAMKVRHKVTFEFVRDREVKKPMQALFNRTPFVMSLLEGKSGHFGRSGDAPQLGDSCLPGESAPNAHGGSIYTDPLAQKFTGHWTVKPGREVRHTNVTKWLDLPYDTTVHYIAAHLHPFAESLELRDLTTRKTIFKSKARNPKKGIGLDHVDSYANARGIQLIKGHEYAMISTYNNTTDQDADSMAVLLMFMKDKEFKKPAMLSSRQAVSQGSNDVHGQAVTLRTTLGDISVRLDPQAAPQTVAQFLRLVQAGAYTGSRVFTVLPNYLIQFGGVYDRATPLSPAQQALVRKLPLEAKGIHRRGVLSMARNPQDPGSGESSFCIFLQEAPHLNGEYTVFGEVEKGMDTVEAIGRLPLNDQNKPKTDVVIQNAVWEPLVLSTPVLSTERLRLHTSLGDMAFRLYPQIAPHTSRQVLQLAKDGAYDGIAVHRIEPGFVAQISAVQGRPVKKLPAEFSGLPHRRGVLSMARQDNDVNSGESSFSILLGRAPHLDGKYTVFGEMESGSDVLAQIEKLPRQGSAPATPFKVLKAAVETLDSHGPEAQSCLPGEAMPEKTVPGLTAESKDSAVWPTDKPVDSKEGVLASGERYKALTFKGITVDRIYPSMKGPWTRAYLLLDPKHQHPYVWITGYKAEVLDGASGKASQEFMCHTKLDVVANPNAGGMSQKVDSFFVISQGQDVVRFPEGFALRLKDDPQQRLDLNVMVLNNNDPSIHRNLDFRATIHYLDDAAAKRRKTLPLRLITGSIYCPTDPSSAGPGQELCRPADTDPRMVQPKSAGHWLVPPGRHVYQQAFDPVLPADTRIHYLMVHVHPYAESFELRDVTANKMVWKGRMVNDPNPEKALLLKTEFYRSTTGLPLQKNHRYELRATYNNPLKHDIDAMASVWIYVLDTAS